VANVSQLTELVRPSVEGLGYELVGVEYLSQGKNSVFRIYIDHANGITADDCAEVSYQVSGVLDVEDPISGVYNLEVSSPGIERPLFTHQHFARFIGQEVSIRLYSAIDGRKKYKGLIESVENESETITIAYEGKTISVKHSQIEKAKLVPVYNFEPTGGPADE
jgi:ribosome maturation factor RimP|tara:strand:+ start:156 stop:647 length:492 start_codon:yes stop_codon:yes gene_type:complete